MTADEIAKLSGIAPELRGVLAELAQRVEALEHPASAPGE